MIFLAGLVIGLSLLNLLINSIAAFRFKEIPLSYRWDLVGWQLLDVVIASGMVTLLLMDRFTGAMLMFGASIFLLIKLPYLRRAVIVEGLKVQEASSGSKDS